MNNASWLPDDDSLTLALWPSLLNASYVFNDNDTIYEDFDELYDVPVGIIFLLSICYGSISILAVAGNSLVMWIVATSRRMQSVTNCFIANLALADIVIGLFAIPFQFQAALLQRWNLPHFMCAFCPFVQVLCVNVSVFTLTAIAIDRHRAILNPLSARPSKLRAKIIIACIWTLSGVLAAPMAAALRVVFVTETSGGRLHLKPFCQNENMSENSMLTYRALLGFLQYLTPLSIISCVYTRMGLKLWGNRAPGNAQDLRDANLMKNKIKEKFKREFKQRCPFGSRGWSASPPTESIDMEKTQSTRTSFRYDWRRPTSSSAYSTNTSLYRGASIRETSRVSIKNMHRETQISSSMRNVNNNNRTGIQRSTSRDSEICTAERYVYLSLGKNKNTRSLNFHDELCL
ncbi:hypothetical protein PV325_000606 [Microctonus aethiopoides]|uniref:G-protein coupled receptors family 1 profile domain-containing protein n=1 Tax=Microctonus aethiopoides TaxID=144406 RepID=A0AA39FLQ6_9HYME|nr:hypothetical protein PV325_000606 [Microctonus aethiopoides]KAK0093708.1 hypothetical protein PV326_012863 [Microctonus aethiopoides]KAK0171945.1 hypothetical protein PV328_005331 [Microctonus aethiopoides]